MPRVVLCFADMKTLTICFLALLALGVPSCAFDAGDLEDESAELDDFLGPYHVDVKRPQPHPYAMAGEAALLAQGTCQQDFGYPLYSGGYYHHDDYFTGRGCGKLTYDGGGTQGGTGATQQGVCGGALCIGPGDGGTGLTSDGRIGYCLLPNGATGNYDQCWDDSDPCNPVRIHPAPTAATCPAGRPFCDDCYGGLWVVGATWGHGKGPDGVCKTADDVYLPYGPTAGPGGGVGIPASCN